MADNNGKVENEAADETESVPDELGLADAPTRRISSALRDMYENNVPAKILLDGLAGRTRNYRQLTVRRAAQMTGLSETEITGLFRDLEKVEVGVYVPGRHGYPSRFVWRYKLLSVAAAASAADAVQSPLTGTE